MPDLHHERPGTYEGCITGVIVSGLLPSTWKNIVRKTLTQKTLFGFFSVSPALVFVKITGLRKIINKNTTLLHFF